MKVCATCPRLLTAFQVRKKLARCHRCRQATPGRPDVTGSLAAKRRAPGVNVDRWRTYAESRARQAYRAEQAASVPSRSWWQTAPQAGFTELAKQQQFRSTPRMVIPLGTDGQPT